MRRGRLAACRRGLVAASLSAAPGFWQAATQADFLRGEVDQLSIDEHGRLTLGPELTKVHDAAAPFVWTIAAGADGAWFLGTGNDGKVIKVDRTGQGSVFYDSTEMEVHALAAGAERRAVRRHLARRPHLSRRCEGPGDDVLRSRRQVHLVARRRSRRQRLRRHRRQGHGLQDHAGRQGREVLRVEDRARRVARVRSEPAAARRHRRARPRVPRRRRGQGLPAARHDVSGDSRDSRRSEGRHLRGGAERPRARAAATRLPDSPMTPPPVTPSIPNVSTEITSITVVDVGASRSRAAVRRPAERRSTMTGAVYRVQPDGLWDELWTAKDDAPYDVAIEPDGAVLVATGAKGKLFRLSGDPVSAVLLTRVPAQQATMIARAGDRTFIATANPGLLMSVSSVRATRGTLRIRREGRAPRLDLGRGGVARQRAGRHEGRGLHALRQHPDAGRSVERLERAVRERRRLADHQSEGALPAVARRADRHRDRGAGADVAVVGLSAAQHPAAGDVDHRSSAGRRVPEAVLERRDRDRGSRRRRAGQARRRRTIRSAAALRRSAGASFSADCRPSRGRPTTTTATS